MRTRLLIILAIIFQLAMFGSPGEAQDFKLDAKGLSQMRFPSPEGVAAKKYLGLSDAPEFTLGQIGSEAILLMIFSMYCPVCQKDAPVVNQLYQMIESDPNLRSKVRFIGIGTGNTPYEVEVFQKKFSIKFPLIPDDDFSIQKISSHDIRTPTFALARKKAGNQLDILKIKVGEIREAREFFDSISQLLVSR